MTVTPRGMLLLLSVWTIGLLAGRYTSHTADYRQMLLVSVSQTESCHVILRTATSSLGLTNKYLPAKVERKKWRKEDTSTHQPMKNEE